MHTETDSDEKAVSNISSVQELKNFSSSLHTRNIWNNLNLFWTEFVVAAHALACIAALSGGEI